jgi:hypothetical protein
VKPAERNQQRQILDQIQKHQVPRKPLTIAAPAGARSLELILSGKANLPQNHENHGRNWDAQPPNHGTLMSSKEHECQIEANVHPLPRRMPLFF